MPSAKPGRRGRCCAPSEPEDVGAILDAGIQTDQCTRDTARAKPRKYKPVFAATIVSGAAVGLDLNYGFVGECRSCSGLGILLRASRSSWAIGGCGFTRRAPPPSRGATMRCITLEPRRGRVHVLRRNVSVRQRLIDVGFGGGRRQILFDRRYARRRRRRFLLVTGGRTGRSLKHP